MVASILVSCSSDEEFGSGVKGKAISFSLSSIKSRTTYDPGDAWIIKWANNDEVRIHSNECPGVNEAEYIVTGSTQQGDIKQKTDATMLYWDADKSVDHTFAAAYPASKATYVSGDKFTFPVPLAQDGSMINAYMVARSTNVKNTIGNGTVLLQFKPIMTTLEVTVQGATGNASLNRTIQHIDFTTNMPCDGDDKFTFDTTTETASPSASSKKIVYTPTSTVAIAGSGTSTPNTYTFNVFIPYVEISSSNKVTIEIYFKDETNADQHYTATLNPTTPIAAGAKKKVKLPTLMQSSYPDGISGLHEGFAEVVNLEF